MKYFMNKIAASFLWGTVMSASWVLAGCEASDFDFDDGWDVNRADSSAVTVDTIQGIDVSMYEKCTSVSRIGGYVDRAPYCRYPCGIGFEPDVCRYGGFMLEATFVC